MSEKLYEARGTRREIMEENKKTIYDGLSRVLTDYENGNADASDLYEKLVLIQNKWEDIITAIDS